MLTVSQEEILRLLHYPLKSVGALVLIFSVYLWSYLFVYFSDLFLPVVFFLPVHIFAYLFHIKWIDSNRESRHKLQFAKQHNNMTTHSQTCNSPL
jgi:hypothetical protein